MNCTSGLAPAAHVRRNGKSGAADSAQGSAGGGEGAAWHTGAAGLRFERKKIQSNTNWNPVISPPRVLPPCAAPARDWRLRRRLLRARLRLRRRVEDKGPRRNG